MAYESGEFDPGIGNRPFPGATAFFNNCLWLMGSTDKEGKIRYTTLSLLDSKAVPLDIEGGKATVSSNWTTQKFDGGFCVSRSALAVCGDSLFFFWNEGTSLPIVKPQLLGSVYSTTGSTALQWSSPIQMFDSSGAALKPATSADVSATAFDDNTVIIATSMGDSLYVGTFRYEDFDADNSKWTAYADRTIDAATIQSVTSNNADINTTVSADFITPTVTNGTPDFWLSVFLYRHGHPDHASGLGIPLNSNGTPQANGTCQAVDGALVAANVSAVLAPLGVARDPAGRLTAWSVSDKTLSGLTFSANSNIFSRVAESSLGAPSVKNGPPSVIYYTDTAHATTSSSGKADTTQYPVYRFIFYGTDSVQCQISRYGTVNVIANAQGWNASVTNKYMVCGIFDAPIPYPDMNNVGHSWEDSEFDIGILTYGTDVTKTSSHQVSYSVLAGFQSEGETGEGVGPAWDISCQAGPAHVSGDSTTTTTSKPITFASKLDFDQGDTPVTSPLGAATTCQLQISTTVYQFLDASGNAVSDGSSAAPTDAPGYATTDVTISPNSLPMSFRPYTVTPGNLESYTPESIDKTMQGLGYSGSYFGDVIVANALVLDPGAKTNYLSASWSESETIPAGFEQSGSTFQENSINVQSSAYVGVSWGGDVGFFGLTTFEEFSAKFLVGASFDYSTETTTESGTTWGIVLDSAWGPPLNTAATDRVTSYSIRIYFLPPPASNKTQWVQELATYLPETPDTGYLGKNAVDTTVAAWRIVFVVDSIVYSSPSRTNYQYSGGN